MKYSRAKLGRTYVVRLEDGDILHEEIERLARIESIRAAALIVVGGADMGSRLIVGPEDAQASPIKPMEIILGDVHEVFGTGTLFPDEKGEPMLHMHVSGGRQSAAITGCIRQGVKVWQVMEVVLFELLDTSAVRIFDSQTGFKLLELL